MIYRRLLWFETTKENDEFLRQELNEKTEEWQHGDEWLKVRDSALCGEKVKYCKGYLSDMRFKFRRKVI